MQADLNSDVALSAANALLSHLRKNPGAANRPAAELAATFGLEESFVAQVLQGIHSHRRAETRPAVARSNGLRTVGSMLRKAWFKVTNRPVLFVAVTFLLAIGGSFLSVFLTVRPYKAEQVDVPFETVQGLVLGVAAIVTLTGFLQMAAYFRHRSSRNALYGGSILFGLLLVSLALLMFTGKGQVRADPAMGPTENINVFVLYLLGAMGMLMLSLMYAGIGSLAAVLGGWTRIKLLERAEETMSRQDLLERYFELQSRLQKSVYPRPADDGPAIFASPLIQWYRNNPLIPNLAIGFALQAIALIGFRASGIEPGVAHGQPPVNIWLFVPICVSIANFLFHILQGYLSKSVGSAMFGSLCLTAGAIVARLLPIMDPSMRGVSTAQYLLSEALDGVLMLAISCAAYLGAVVQSRAAKEASLQRNDQAAVLSEMVRIQWKLSNEAATICVMVVDAAKSSEMKADADPLAVEYTFREYQEWIEAISAERSGRVHSTAGDGAVVAFNTCNLALSAARKIQTDVFLFNKDVNRLAQPFRLRIGLHSGEVVGDINQVQFTEVIDIAAHIESACPVGGITATDEVVNRLPEEQFIDLKARVDGHEVFLVSNPTEYA